MKEIVYQYLKSLSLFEEKELQSLTEKLPVKAYPKKFVIQELGEVAKYCFFVLKGCVRQYHIEDGIEKTTAFFTEGEAIVDFESFQQGTACKHYWVTVEDSVLMYGTAEDETNTYAEFPQLEQLTRKMMADSFGKMQHDFADFISASSEDRYLKLLNTRPELLLRVPQHQIASYLGMTPESLSRLKKRLQQKRKD